MKLRYLQTKASYSAAAAGLSHSVAGQVIEAGLSLMPLFHHYTQQCGTRGVSALGQSHVWSLGRVWY